MYSALRFSRVFSPVFIVLFLLALPLSAVAQRGKKDPIPGSGGTPPPPIPAIAPTGVTKTSDLNGDGKADLLWYNPATGQSVAWLMDGKSALSTAALPVEPGSKIAATADFNGDGMADLIWSNASSGQISLWLMNGTSVSSTTILLTDPLWKVIEAADFNGDGISDLLLRNASTNQTVAWLMNGGTVTSWSLLLTDADWNVVATADFNGDTKSDLLWYNAATGQTAAWLMNGTAQLSSATLVTDPKWKASATADFNGDKMSDILWYNAATGETALWLMNGTTMVDRSTLLIDPNWKVSATGDLNGDGKADLLWLNLSTGQTAAWMIDGKNVTGSATLLTDPNWKVHATADLDADGKSDILWYNAATGQTSAWLMNGIAATSGANLFTDPSWRMGCLKSSSLTPELACNDALANGSLGSVATPANQAPVVNAGSDQIITLPATARLSGAANDDGIPIRLLTAAWSQVSGPGTVIFGNASSLLTSATFPTAGTYTLRLIANDSELSAGDDLVIVVNSSTTGTSGRPKNNAPVVNAGPDQTITLPSSANLLGAASDDGSPNKTLTTVWTKVNGSGSVTFSNAYAYSTTASFSTAGTYTLRLTATDGSVFRGDDLIVVVKAASATNRAPVVNAGPDQMITFPSAATLAGTTTDDGLPIGSTYSTAWTKISGPGSVTFGNAASLNSTATFSVAGTYTLRLTATDSALSTSDDVNVVVTGKAASNKPPAVNAGPDQVITSPAAATLAGTATDDGVPTASTLTLSWSKVSGPASVVFVNASTANASATFLGSGTYILRLTASDGSLSTADDVVITVNPAVPTPAANAAPVVNAGSDQTITLPAAANLAGSVTDDGLPTGSAITKTWSKVSGPGSVTFGNPSSASTTASFSVAGSYTLRLTASDSALSSADNVVITVNPIPPTNTAPVVTAGSNQSIALSSAAILSGTATDDGLPTGSSLAKAWSKVSGPGTVSFGAVGALSTTATFSTSGTYVLQLTASDGLLSSSSTLTVSVMASLVSTKSIFVGQVGTGTGTGVNCSNALPVSFVNNQANWGTGTNQIGPGTTVNLCGTIVGGVDSMFPVTTRAESTAIPSLSVGSPEPKFHPLFLSAPIQP